MAKLIILDLDGCISDDRWRRQYIEESWDAYHSRAAFDDAINLDILENVKYQPSYQHAICTGRPEQYHLTTTEWLNKKHITTPYLLMRGAMDYRSSVIIKSDMLAELRMHGHEIVAAYDDRLDICKMYEREGVPRIYRLTAEGVCDEITSTMPQ